jgi:radical SAM superfamily enzyme YgiQ (UPF0313 family)
MSAVLYVVPLAESHRTAEENLGVGYLVAFLKNKGYKSEVIDAWLEGLNDAELFQRIDYYIKSCQKVLFVGISTYVSNVSGVKRIVNHIKTNYDLPIIAGGFGPSFFPREFLEIGIDIVSIGEGEICSIQLCEYFEGRIGITDIDGIVYRLGNRLVRTHCGNLVFDIDALPFPDRSTMKSVMARKSAVNVLSARGCAGNCSFCSVIAFGKLKNGNACRQRSIGNFLDEIEALHVEGVDLFKVIDDSFIEAPRGEEWCREFRDEIKQRGLQVRFRGSLTAEHVTEAIIANLKEAGFFSFACGIENFSQRVLSQYGKRATVEDNLRSLEIFRKFGIRVQCGLILFDPYTSIDDLRINLKYMKEYPEVLMKGIFSELYAAGGTAFTNKMLFSQETGFIRENENYKYEIIDETVSRVYAAMKKWQKMCSNTFNVVTDPLTAPKNISEDSANKLYAIYKKLHTRDLLIFEQVLNIVKNNEEMEFIDLEIRNSTKLFTCAKESAARIYQKERMVFDGSSSKYL